MKPSYQIYPILLAVQLFAGRAQAGDEVADTANQADAPADMTAFQKELVVIINQQRPKWSQAQRDELAAYVSAHLQEVAADKLTQSTASVILEHFGENMARMGTVGNPDELSMRYNKEFLRWEIDRFATRTEMPLADKAELEALVRDCFSKVAGMLRIWTPEEVHERIDIMVKQQTEQAIQALRDPLYPGLKHPVSADTFAEYFTSFCDDFKKVLFASDERDIISKCRQLPPFRVVNRANVSLNYLRILMARTEEYDEALKEVAEALVGIFREKFNKLGEDVRSAAKSNDFNTVRKLIQQHKQGEQAEQKAEGEK